MICTEPLARLVVHRTNFEATSLVAGVSQLINIISSALVQVAFFS